MLHVTFPGVPQSRAVDDRTSLRCQRAMSLLDLRVRTRNRLNIRRRCQLVRMRRSMKRKTLM